MLAKIMRVATGDHDSSAPRALSCGFGVCAWVCVLVLIAPVACVAHAFIDHSREIKQFTDAKQSKHHVERSERFVCYLGSKVCRGGSPDPRGKAGAPRARIGDNQATTSEIASAYPPVLHAHIFLALSLKYICNVMMTVTRATGELNRGQAARQGSTCLCGASDRRTLTSPMRIPAWRVGPDRGTAVPFWGNLFRNFTSVLRFPLLNITAS